MIAMAFRVFQPVSFKKIDCFGAPCGISMNPQRNQEAVRKSVACMRDYIACMRQCMAALGDALAGFKKTSSASPSSEVARQNYNRPLLARNAAIQKPRQCRMTAKRLSHRIADSTSNQFQTALSTATFPAASHPPIVTARELWPITGEVAADKVRRNVLSADKALRDHPAPVRSP